ncbi:MAG TPA: hypothetical protein VJO34_00790 [Methylomirabilota bacterium]|nr:hypothetical protein [Methylomirabilota bacterium]
MKRLLAVITLLLTAIFALAITVEAAPRVATIQVKGMVCSS